MENSYKTKLDEEQTKAKKLSDTIHTLTIDKKALEIASELAVDGCSDALLPHIKSRLRLEFENDQPVIKVLDLQGNLSATNINDFSKEIAETKFLAPLIKASSARGGGISLGAVEPQPKKFNEYSESELIKIKKENPQDYARIRDEYYQKIRKHCYEKANCN